ncbi:S41 family peptidase [Polaribacter porphyrae]|uniref:Tricorn protease homolog n=1 Tax=Polaribacter porphyrae TaxID=1137780 RepID=A0A2S7WNW5_9FLAO|nr:S41 family peptidase [Polaribacter porphyrae]PQJ79308.1 MdsD protein [Polaribacter porphyrae]
MHKSLFTLFLIFTFNLILAQNSLIRHPSLHPNGTELAFSYQGDIWIYNLKTNQTKRLTVHEAYESNPIWKSDGSEIAFTSNRKGSNNIFTISKDGGMPKQLTYYPTTDTPYDWTSDNNILFTTNRILKGPQWDAQTYHVKGNGGTPERTITALGSMATQSPNGKFIAYAKGACRISREDYSGSAQRDIWIFNKNSNKYIQITNTLKNDHSPLWDNDGNLYYIGAESGRYNIYKQAISDNGSANGISKKLTNQKKNGVVSFTVSDNGIIVYSTLFNVYHLKNGKSKKLNISLTTDYRFELEKTATTSSNISSFDISPNGKLAAMEIQNEIFVKENNKEKRNTNNVSNHPYRDRNPQWISNKEVLFISDRSGQNEIYVSSSKDTLVGLERSLKIETKKLTKSKEDVYNLLVSPNHKKITYQVGRGDLMVADYEDGKIKNIKAFSEGWAAPSGVSWSPDSKYLAYSQQDLDFDSEIFIQSVENPDEKTNVSMHPRSDVSPTWSPDGKMLSFASNRSGNRGGIDFDIWMVWLKKEDWEKTRTDRQNGEYYKPKPVKKKKGKKTVKVSIDRDRIYDRLVKVTRLPDDEFGGIFSPDSKYIYYSATNPAKNSRSFYKVKLDEGSPKEIKGTSRIGGFSAVNNKFYFTSRGRLNELNPKSDRVTSLPHSAKYMQDFKAVNAQMFDEGTRVLTMGFYDPNFHGYDWKGLVKQYRPLALMASTAQDYAFIFNQLLGQLNASHMGYGAGTPERRNSDNIGLLGLEVKNTNKGAEILYVLNNSVADKSKVDLNVGDVVTAINNEKIDVNTNFYSLLKNTRGDEVLLSLASGKEVVARTTRSLRGLQYQAWVDSRKKMVDKFSNGKLGYIHIQGMNAPSFERFERELKASGYGKEGIVIDVRYNGGGWTTDRLMAVLNVYQHAYTVPRGAAKNLKKENKKFTKNYPFNERAILTVNTKPTVALCNENSYSNAEIFSHAYKNLGLGKLVGQPTFGAVISTGGYSLTQGFVRMPFRAWYVAKSGKNMENEAPAVPDYLVKNAPGWGDRGEDDQLKKAVEVLLQDIE